jgi:integrase
MLREIDAATLRPGRETTLGAFLAAWVEGRQPHVRPSTLAGYRWYLSKYVYPALGDTPLPELDPADLTRLYSALTLSPKSLRNLHGILRRALRDAVAWGYVERNVVALVQPPSNPRKEMHIWSPEEMRAFLEHVADDWLYPAWLLFATTEMRRGEVSGLRWTDLDLDDARLYVRAPRVVVAGQAVTSQPKTSAGRRTLSLDATTVAALRGHTLATARSCSAGRTVDRSARSYCRSGSVGTPRLLDSRGSGSTTCGTPTRP